MNTFTITSQPYYNQYSQCYQNILTLNVEPNGPLKRIVRRIQFAKLSPYQADTDCYSRPNCGLALISLPNGMSCCGDVNIYGYNGNKCNNLMTPNDIPNLITYLLANGYQIETQLTNMLNQSKLTFTDKTLALMVTYYENGQPNITYMR